MFCNLTLQGASRVRDHVIAEFPVPPVVKQAVISLPIDAAFDRFTSQIAAWWPTVTHSISRNENATVVMEGHVGGRLFERDTSGEEHQWGTVTRWMPPKSVAFTWHVGRAEATAQRVEIFFEQLVDGSTAIELVHSGWEKLGADGEQIRAPYETGWDTVFAEYLELNRGSAR